ncbi:acylneuraminate cytidylyltransferase family protein [Telluribacter sp.]|jgi:N-acylneuraminate cytidylyltransferase|uniref:acylneuraminate cytidylyltransferase family protein n=1 Tax=Telluribacter sp. TaxID=1978767 RepID=UPI002E1457C8|nr:acylneuraminate cytidylyltransferase family protein [Telluribacter sp.]
MEVLALIPARGGSKGLPDKNILPLSGHPLIAYSIRAALSTPAVTRTIVTTDAEKIAEVAIRYGAEVPFLRPEALAQDLSTDWEVFEHALRWLRDHENYQPDLVVQLRPTSPVRQVTLIEKAVWRMAHSPEADSLRVVTPAPITPYKMWTLPDGDESPMQPLLQAPGLKEHYNQPRQILPQVYWQIGTLDVIRPHVILEKHSMSGAIILPMVVPNELAVDIDDLQSFKRAEEAIRSYDCVKFDD